ncbi:hypothetical protein ACPV5O_26605 [Vibrio maritimus]|uniref:hypothetical protein n=1 Tax=Vibrio maritimus TaxID=990268 RepID=UPI0040675C57
MMYRQLLSEVHEDVRHRGVVHREEAFVLVGTLCAMKVAYEAARQIDTARYIMDQVKCLQSNWRDVEQIIVNVYHYLGD